MIEEARNRRQAVWAVGALAVLAYLPALTSAPGRMPSDSKLYLYLDPGRFVADAASTFDGRQFAGWVPHQHVAYLWPSGPWFWVFDLLAVPDWVAHRLWIGTILLAGGAGVRWSARVLGLGQAAAMSAAVVYQVSLYVLPYVSRTSVMLLPWAGLGWIVALTVRATRRRTWGDPAAIALVVLTVGAVNATALAMIVPGPVLWLVHAVAQRSVTWRQAVVVAARTAVLAVGASLWWIVMLVVHGRYGTDVLPYSESLADVSLTATSSEVWRSLGYWLFYVRDPAAAATTESLRYLVSTPAIVVSYLVPLTAVAALAWLRWAHRRFALMLVVTGVVLSVGVHPVDDRSPLVRLLAGGDESGLALALRSSTRALPVMVLGLALALAMAVQSAASLRVPRVGWPGHHAAGVLVVGLAIANMPSLWSGALVDPALERDADPPSGWLAAAAELDAGDTEARVLQLPGAEFGAFRWGHTVDQPLPGLTDKPLVTRDLLPLGSAAAMDLLFALDDRVQDGVLEPAAVAPIAALLGADTVWLANDIAFDRYRTARPEVVRAAVVDAPGLGEPSAFGEPFLNRAEVPMTDERAVGDDRVGRPLRPVELVPVDGDVTIVRAREHLLYVSGSGDGLVDAAASGLLAPDRAAVRYTADLNGSDAITDGLGLVVTDSNRDRARHWRSSQDVTGFTETGGPATATLREVSGDARLDVFETSDPTTQTVAIQRGPVTATASSYGEPFAYLPEHRPAMAVDGDPTTAWLVGEHGDPIGEWIRLEFEGRTSELTVHQPDVPGARRITRIRVVEADAAMPERTEQLDERSWNGEGQVIPLSSDGAVGTVDLVIEAVAGGEPFTGTAVAGVGFSEIDLGHGPTEEVVRPPHDALDTIEGAAPLGLVFTRLRTDPMDRWRDDPEPALVREFDLPNTRTFRIEPTVRIDARATDRALADLFGWPAVASSRLTGSPRHAGVAAVDGDPSTAWITAFDDVAGARLWLTGAAEPIDRIQVRQPVAGFSEVQAITLRSGEEERVVRLRPDAGGTAAGRVEPPLPAGDIEVELTDVELAITTDRRFGDPVVLPAAVSEIDFEGRPRSTPVGRQRALLECIPVATVDDTIVRATIEIDGDGWMDGRPPIVTPCDLAVDLGAGSHVVRSAPSELPITLDRIVLDDGIRSSLASIDAQASVTNIERGRFSRTVEVRGCTDGCWLVLGEGHNEAWTASGPDGPLGPQELIDGGFNGWWIEPTATSALIELRWTAQRALTVALVATLATALVAIVLVARDVRGRHSLAAVRAPPPGLLADDHPIERHTAVIAGATWVLAAWLLIGPAQALWGLAAAAAVLLTRRRRLGELTAVAGLLVVAIIVVVRERRSAPLPDGGWPGTFESLHALGMFAVASLLVGALTADDADDALDER